MDLLEEFYELIKPHLTWSNLFIAVLTFLIISNGAPTSHKDRMTAKAIKDAFDADKYKKQK